MPLLDAAAGERLTLPGAASATLIEPYGDRNPLSGAVRLWIADLSLPVDALSYSAKHGSPIRYSYVPKRWPLSYYQTVFATEPGSAEMPSAGRPFTRDVLDRIESKGVAVVPITLHTGVSSLDSDELPYPERYRVTATAARAINEARMRGGQIVAVGTTVVRALETVALPNGSVRASTGWTELVVNPDRGLNVVDAMLTGFHAPKASHLAMLEALAGRDHLSHAYNSALSNGYRWHEFGDVHLILP
jgi:S-adenosylmethionine:tRNA ribosyltransferase-isomerase